MKKRLLALLMALAMLLSLAACGKEEQTKKTDEAPRTEEKPFVPADAVELWNKIDEVMDALDCYGTKQEMKSTYYVNGNKFTINGTADSVRSAEGDGFYFYMYGKNSFACEALEVNESIEMKDAFYDGKMYRMNKGDGIDQRLCAAVTAEEYLESEDNTSLEDLKLEECMNKDFSKEVDGTWKLSFSGYTKKTVDLFMQEMSLDEESLFGGSLGANVSDMKVTALADEKFRSTEVSIQLLFDLKEDSTTAPEFSIEMTFDRFNEAEFDFDAFLPEEYTEVDSLLVLDQFEDALDELRNAKKGKFTATSKANMDFGGEKVSTDEVDEITYGEENGSFYFDGKITEDGESYELKFRNGTLTYTQDGASEEIPVEEEDAKALVMGMIDSATFVSERVTSVKETEEGTYQIEFAKIDESFGSDFLEMEELKSVSGTQELTVTMKDGKLVQYSVAIIIQGKVGDLLKSENFTVASEVTFVVEEVEENKAA